MNDWDSCSVDGVAKIQCVELIFERIITVVASFAGIAFFVMLLVGGFRLLFSGGNPKETEAAKGTITSAFLGLFLVVGSYLFISFVSSFTGLNLTTFKVVGF